MKNPVTSNSLVSYIIFSLLFLANSPIASPSIYSTLIFYHFPVKCFKTYSLAPRNFYPYLMSHHFPYVLVKGGRLPPKCAAISFLFWFSPPLCSLFTFSHLCISQIKAILCKGRELGTLESWHNVSRKWNLPMN